MRPPPHPAAPGHQAPAALPMKARCHAATHLPAGASLVGQLAREIDFPAQFGAGEFLGNLCPARPPPRPPAAAAGSSAAGRRDWSSWSLAAADGNSCNLWATQLMLHRRLCRPAGHQTRRQEHPVEPGAWQPAGRAAHPGRRHSASQRAPGLLDQQGCTGQLRVRSGGCAAAPGCTIASSCKAANCKPAWLCCSSLRMLLLGHLRPCMPACADHTLRLGAALR